ncbi:MAG: YicC/YloC family endoribonuclease [Planctomycetota bacterium]
MAVIASMTGAGFAAGDSEVGPVRLEVRSVNGRGLSLKQRLTSRCSAFETAIEERVRRRLKRGSVLVVIERGSSAASQSGSSAGSLPEREALQSIATELQEIATQLGLPMPTLTEVLAVAGSGGSRESAATSQPLPEQLGALVDAALTQLLEHRATDGAGTVAAITAELDSFDVLADQVVKRAPQLIEHYRDRLLQRVQEFVQHHVPDAPPAIDLVREVAIYSDKVDVAEELQRLRAHGDEIRALIARGGEVGRRLDFLLQELLRETNTLGSKSPDTEVAHAVVAMKGHIATIKEQVQNLE